MAKALLLAHILVQDQEQVLVQEQEQVLVLERFLAKLILLME
jgi:hypothetical protein